MKKKNTKKDRMMEYINNKYTDDTFEYRNVTGGYLGSDEYKILVESEKYPGKPIRVICWENDGMEEYADTYLGVKFEDQTREYLSERISENFGTNFYLKYSNSQIGCTVNGSSNTTFNEYISDASSDIWVTVAVSCEPENFDKGLMFEKIKKMFFDSATSGYIYFISSEKLSSSGNGIENFKGYIKNKEYFKRLSIIKKNMSEFESIEWTDGK